MKHETTVAIMYPHVKGELARCRSEIDGSYEIHINIERLWGRLQNEDSFIEQFSELYAHERLHAILTEYGVECNVESEWYVRMLLGQDWDESFEKMYHGYRDVEFPSMDEL